VLLAGLLYLGAGLGLLAVSLFQARPWPAFTRVDYYRLVLVALVGGCAGPILLLVGLGRVSGVVGALLLNLEGVFTVMLAVLIFRDRLVGMEWAGAAFILGGAAVVSYRPGELTADWVGALCIASACLCWGIDNNLLQRLSSHDPVTIVQVKALSAGAANLLLALTIGQRIASVSIVPAAGALGFVCYGLSIVFDVYALRYLGAAREAAVFATAPFLGALAALPVLGERLGRTDAIGAGLMLVGVVAFRYRASS
jgi:drug/metabolite transporter (DMT)-like permease